MASCPPVLSGWAGRILESLGDTGTPTGRVVSWLQNNLFRLNLAIDESFYLTSSGCIEPEMTTNQSGIYEQQYLCFYLSSQVIANLGAAGYDWQEIAGEKQGKIKKVSRNDIAKNYRLEANDCKSILEELLDWYDQNASGGSPSQILYADRGHVSQASLMPPCGCYSPYNTIFNSCSSGSSDDGGETFNFLTDEA